MRFEYHWIEQTNFPIYSVLLTYNNSLVMLKEPEGLYATHKESSLICYDINTKLKKFEWPALNKDVELTGRIALINVKHKDIIPIIKFATLQFPAFCCGIGYTGKLKWKVPFSKPKFSSQLLIDDIFILAIAGSNLTGIDINTGKILWNREIEIQSSSILCKEYIVTVSADSTIFVLEPKTGEILKEIDIFSSEFVLCKAKSKTRNVSPVIISFSKVLWEKGGFLNSIILAFDEKFNIIWKFIIPAAINRPLYDKTSEMIFVETYNRELLGLRSKDGSIIFRYQLPNRDALSGVQPLLSGKLVIFPGQKTIRVFEIATGKLYKEIELSSPVEIITSKLGYLYCLDSLKGEVYIIDTWSGTVLEVEKKVSPVIYAKKLDDNLIFVSSYKKFALIEV